jgi:tetratricopeptide (TPR) repeat protein
MNRDEIYRTGMSAYQDGRYLDAIDCLNKLADKIDTTTGILSRFYLARAHYEVALTMFQQRMFRDAACHFRTAAKFSPEGMSVGRYLASCYAGDRQYGLAAIELERILATHPA